jgi:hypothetical protein
MNTEHNKTDEVKSSEEMVEMPTTISEKKHTTKHVAMEDEMSATDNQLYGNFGRWSKIYAVLGLIYAGFTILAGIPYIILLGFGLLMIAAGVFYIIAYNKVMKSSDLVKSLSKLQNNPKEFKNTTDEIVLNLTGYFKIISIINLTAIIAGIVITIIFFIFFAAAFSSVYQNASTNTEPVRTINYR